MSLDEVKQLNIPDSPGSYQFYDDKGVIIYIGKAAELRSRVLSYWRKSANHSAHKLQMMERIARVVWIVTETEIEALLLEANLVKRHQPYYNVLLRDDKRFQYVMVSTEDEVPGVFTTRRHEKGGVYFGPFTNGQAVRETLKAIRKLWPYCTARKVGPRCCFYHQIGRCAGPCCGAVSLAEYNRRVIKPIILFLEGKKGKIITNYELRITKLEKRLVKEKSLSEPERIEMENELREAKYLLLNMKNVLEHTRVLGVGEQYAYDVVELGKLLGLPRVPQRIEGYDISNLFGREAVGSMVVFKDGEADKDQYRKFKIRLGQGEANDIGMLREVLSRRMTHMEDGNIKNSTIEHRPSPIAHRPSPIAHRPSDFWPKPDLIIIDGGKAQRNAALSVLKKAGLDIPVIAISKGLGLRHAGAPDLLFVPGSATPLKLPLNSPALHVVKRVRDEAHRFAVGYHTVLRRKKMFR